MMRVPYRWKALGILWVSYFLLQGTRQIYGATLPQIKADLGASDLEMGLVASSFFMAYAAMVPFGGFIADLFRRKWVIVAGAALFSAGVFSVSFAHSLAVMLFTYGILNGAGQSMVPVASTSVIQQLHSDSRATALSLYQIALYAGVILCSVASGYLGSLGPGGWRGAFLVFGGLSLMWVAVLVTGLKDIPPASDDCGSGARPSVAASLKAALAAMFSKPSAVLMTVAFGLSNFGGIGFRTWMPTYLQRTFDSLTPASAAFHAVFWFYAGGFAGLLAASRISDRWKRRGNIGARLDCGLIGLVLAAPAVVLVANSPGSLWVTAAGLLAYGFINAFYDANFIASFYEVITPRYRTSAYGIFACGAFVMGSFAPAVLGFIGGRFSFSTAMSMLGVFYLAGAAAILIARVRFLKRDYADGS
jgi:MFS family permease